MSCQTYPARAGVVERCEEMSETPLSAGSRSVAKLSFSVRRKLAHLDQLESHLLELTEQIVQVVLPADRAAQHRLDGLDLGSEAERICEVLAHPTPHADLVVQRH